MFDRVLLVGDSHGNSRFLRLALDTAARLGIRLVVSVGDFGFWPDGQRFIADCRRQAKTLGIILLVIDGNHDAPGQGRRDDGGYLAWTAPTTDRLRLDPVLLDTPELWHVERGTRLTVAGQDICFVGSAISIDRAARTTGESWWPTEALAETETDRIVAGGPADLLISHDSAWDPPGTRPIRFAPELATDLALQRHRMQRIVKALAPKLHIHGHWHRRYMTDTYTGPVLGLDYESTLGLHVIDLTQLGIQAGHAGGIMVEGSWYCPSIPQHLIDATTDWRTATIDVATWQNRINVRTPYLLKAKERPDADGHQPLRCPAIGASATVTCPLRNTGADTFTAVTLSKPRIETAPDAPDRICTQTSVTFPPDGTAAKYRQDHQYGTTAWRNLYQPGRAMIESFNGYAKDPAHEALAEPGRRRGRGRTAQHLATTILVAAANLRRIATFIAVKANPKRAAQIERARNTRKAKASLRNHLPQSNAPPGVTDHATA